jgi:hypothetical protein
LPWPPGESYINIIDVAVLDTFVGSRRSPHDGGRRPANGATRHYVQAQEKGEGGGVQEKSMQVTDDALRMMDLLKGHLTYCKAHMQMF